MSKVRIETILKLLKKKDLAFIFLILALFVVLGLGLLWYVEKPQAEKPKPVPSVSIGCDRVLWKSAQIELGASIKNIDKPSLNWTIDGKNVGNSQKLSHTFDIGEHLVILNVSFNNNTITSKQSIVILDSVDGISVRDSQASNNQWAFQTIYKGKNHGVKGVLISVDTSPPEEVNPCGSYTSKPLFAGQHTWKAQYQGATVASGAFNLKEVSEIKIARIDVAPSYNAGETVEGRIVLKNTGSATIKGFDIRTLAVNNNYAWMGEKARKEYFDQYTSDIRPGEMYEIPIRVTIPEKVSGIRPSGKYTITIDLILNGRTVDTKAVNTEVK